MVLNSMAGILHLFLRKRSTRVCAQFADHRALFEALEQEAPDAIRCLAGRVSGAIYKIGKNHRLSDEDIEELICDALTICLQKIKDGKYLFQGYDPATFVIEIAKNRALNFRRSALRHNTEALQPPDEKHEEPEFGAGVETELLEKLLAQLDPNCANLIRLKYLEERRDKDVIALKLTQYTTVDALKTHRSKCFKKLVELGAAVSRFNQ